MAEHTTRKLSIDDRAISSVDTAGPEIPDSYLRGAVCGPVEWGPGMAMEKAMRCARDIQDFREHTIDQGSSTFDFSNRHGKKK